VKVEAVVRGYLGGGGGGESRLAPSKSREVAEAGRDCGVRSWE